MTIGRRLTSAFLVILLLFAVNEVIQVWSARLRSRSMTTVSRALKRQLVLSTLEGRVADLHKQVSLLGQTEADAGPIPGAAQALEEELGRVSADIRTLASLSDSEDTAAVTELSRTFKDLAEDWRRFYDYFGVEPSWALTFQVKAEPLGRHVVMDLVPALQQQQSDRVEQAENEFERIQRVTQRVSLSIFAVSMLVSIAIAWHLARFLRHRLGQLKLGASMIGLMNLEHRIEITSRDELASVAASFNDMAVRLAEAQKELTLANAELTTRHAEVEAQRAATESLLLNILPGPIATELATRGEVEPRYFEDVTILFTDFVGFTLATERLAADELVSVLHDYFKAFDEITDRYGLEKLKTIGDSYFCAGGLTRRPSHPIDATLAAFEMIRVVQQVVLPDGSRLAVRVGLHSGPVIAGVVGTKKFAFDVWGDTVNRASRMETAAERNRINVSSAIQRRIKDFFVTQSRGLICTKEGTELEMFSVGGVLPGLLQERQIPPPAFARRYSAYFERELLAFPALLVEGLSVPANLAVDTNPLVR